MARVYSYLCELEMNGVLSDEVIGRTRMYTPTQEVERYFANRLRGIAAAYKQIPGARYGMG